MAVAARKASASICMLIAVLSARRGDFGGIECCREPLLFAIIACALPEARASDPGRAMPSDDLAVGVFADHVVQEHVLGDDGVAFHAHHLGFVDDTATT